MKTFKLGVDVDGVVLDSGPLYHKAFQDKGFLLDPDKKYVWEFEEMYHVSSEVVRAVFDEVEQMTEVPLIPGALILNKIAALPYVDPIIQFVSSRSAKVWYPTRQILLGYFDFPFTLTCGESKGKYCKSYDIDFFVEDGPPHVEDIYFNSSTEIYVLNKPYNQRIFIPTNPRTVRVSNWSEILLHIIRTHYVENVGKNPTDRVTI